jgi:integrase
VGGYWITQFRDLNGVKRKVSLGPVKKVSKYDAEKELEGILRPINAKAGVPVSRDAKFGEFTTDVYLKWYMGKWKSSTARSNEERIRFHLLPLFGARRLSSLTDLEMQSMLEDKAKAGLSYSVVAHLRWDLRQILGLAVSKGALDRNPAEELFVPSNAARPERRRMSLDEVQQFFSVLDLRERVIGGLAVLAGMRPGEILALRKTSLQEGGFASIQHRIYRGELDTPKTFKSRRQAALGDALSEWIKQWIELLPASPEDWLFPCETLDMPISRDNVWRRSFVPRLKTVGLEWASFQVMRRTHASLLADLEVDPQVRAEQMGHGVDVNQNQYTRASLERRQQAVNSLQKALGLLQ